MRWTCLLTRGNNNDVKKSMAPCLMDSGRGRGRGIVSVGGGIKCWLQKLVVVLACAGTLVRPVTDDPIYAVADIFPNFC